MQVTTKYRALNWLNLQPNFLKNQTKKVSYGLIKLLIFTIFLFCFFTTFGQTCMVETVTGNGTHGFMDGTGGPTGTAQFKYPTGVAVEANGYIYVADRNNHRIRKIASDGTTTTFSGNGSIAFMDGTGGPNGTAQFYYPEGVAIDAQNNVYVADKSHHRIRKIAPDGTTTTFSGNGTPGFMDGTGGPNGAAQFSSPSGVAIDAQNNVYVADQLNHRIRKILPDGTATTLAGTGTLGFMDGPGGIAQFSNPYGVAVDLQGNVFVADIENNRIRKIAPDGTTSTLAGNGMQGHLDGTGGPNGTAEFFKPTGVTVDAQNNIYVAGFLNNRIRKIDSNGNVTTLAGSGVDGFQDGPANNAQFNDPFGITIDDQNNIYIADAQNRRIRKISCASCKITAININNISNCNSSGVLSSYTADVTVNFTNPPTTGNLQLNGDGLATVAVDNLDNTTSHTFTDIIMNADGQPINLAASFSANSSCTFTNTNAGIAPADCACPLEVSTLAGNGTYGFLDGTGGPNGTAQFSSPRGVAVDLQGNVYVADQWNHRIRKITPGGITSTLAGNGTYGFLDGTGGPNGTTQFLYPLGVAVDLQGNVYVADGGNHRIRKIAPDGITSTLAGNGTYGFLDGTGGPNGTTQFSYPSGVAVDLQGNVYVADGGSRIRKVAPDGMTSTLAGNGTHGFTDGTGGPNGTTQFSSPTGVAVDLQGNVYVADTYYNSRIRKIAPDGMTSTLAGNGTRGFADGTGGPNGTAQFSSPTGVAVDLQGNVYVADTYNSRIRKIAPDGMTSTLAGNGTHGFADGIGGLNGTAQFSSPSGVAVDLQGNVYVADSSNYRIRKIDCTSCTTCLNIQTNLNFITDETSNDSCNYQVDITQSKLYCIDSIKITWTSATGFDTTFIDSTMLTPLQVRLPANTYDVQTNTFLEDGTICEDSRQIICKGCGNCSDMQTALKFTTLSTSNDSCNYQVGITQPELYCIDSIKIEWSSNSGFDSIMLDSTMLTSLQMRVPCDTYSIKSTIFLEDGTSCQYCREVICENCCDCSEIEATIVIAKLSETTDSCEYGIIVAPSSLHCLDSIKIHWNADMGFDSILIDSTMTSPLRIKVPCSDYTVQSSAFLKDGTTCSNNWMLACEGCNTCDTIIVVSTTLTGVHDTTALENIIADCTIENGATVTFQAGKSITLIPGFHVKTGANFTALIVDSPNCSDNNNIQQEEDLISKKLINQTIILDEINYVNESPKVDMKIAPNPFSNYTTIHYYLPQPNKTQLLIYNMNGQLMETVKIKDNEKGWNQLGYQSTNLQAGIYYIVLQTGQNLITKKIIIH